MSTAVGHRRRELPRSSLPAVLVVPAVLGLSLLLLPLLALLVRTPWSRLPELLGGGQAADALRLSLGTATAATLLCLLLGTPLALALARPSRWRRPLLSLVTVPMVLPPVVGGVALLLLLGRRGLLGRHLDALGVTVSFSTAAVVVAQTFVALPFLVLSVEAALRAVDRREEAAATVLGASRWTVLRRVTVPAVAPAVGAGAVLCFARALGEFGATITFAGNLPGVTQTMPVAVYLAMERDPEAAVALAMVLLGASVAVLLVLRGRWAVRS